MIREKMQIDIPSHSETMKNRPLITFALFTYNQEKYIYDAIQGALSQTYSPLEIIISDDHSTDHTFELITKITNQYDGPHKIYINQNKINLGIAFHVNKIFEMANSELIIAAAGDDISLPRRTEIIYNFYKKGHPFLIHSRAIEINYQGIETGNIIPYKPLIKPELQNAAISDTLYLGATGAWNKSLYSEFGTISQKNSYEDMVLGFRAIIMNSIEFIDEPLIKYRVGSGISTCKPDTKNFKTLIHKKKELLEAHISILKQRQEDWLKKNPVENEINHKIFLKLSVYEQRLEIINTPLKIIYIPLINPKIMVINILQLIASKLRKLIK